MKTTNLLFLLVTLGGLGEEHLVDAGEHTTRGDGHVGEELVQLLIVADRELDVARHDAGLLVVTSSVASQLKDLSSEVLEDGCHVHGGTGTNSGCHAHVTHVSAHTTDRELKACLGRSGGALAAGLAASALALSRHTVDELFLKQECCEGGVWRVTTILVEQGRRQCETS